MEGHCSTSQSPQWAVVPMEEEEEEEEVVVVLVTVVPIFFCSSTSPRLRSVILPLPNALRKRITAAAVYPLTLPFPSAIQSHTNIGNYPARF